MKAEYIHRFLVFMYVRTCSYSEKQKLASLRETYSQLQRSYQHIEKDLGRRKEREAELLTLTEKLSSANAELQADRSSHEAKV